jgi:outer membrane protein OmpA-like peptidoglycan-associated protein
MCPAFGAVAASTQNPMPAAAPPGGSVPLCPGLTIVTAVAQKDGDYESIKTIEAVTPQAIELNFSSEHMSTDIFSTEPPKLVHTSIKRSVRTEDAANAQQYLQIFYEKLPEQIPGTTAIGVSSAILSALKTRGETELGIYLPITGTPAPSRASHPNIYDYAETAKIHRVEKTSVSIPVLVNDRLENLPAIHAAGVYFGDKNEFYFLDDVANPITLKFRLGIGAVNASGADQSKALGGNQKAGGDRDTLSVTKITYRCAAQVSKPAEVLEQSLLRRETVEIYDIYFSFGSDVIRPESEPTLRDIAEVMTRHPDWHLAVGGHTDSIGTDAYNRGLSQSRAEAVRDALIARYHIAPAALTSSGYGASEPRDTNDTVEGRARNRRVELARQ